MRIYFYSLVILCLVLITHIVGVNGMYAACPSYNIFMHILGGIGVGLAVCAAVKLHGGNIAHKGRVIIIGVLVMGMIWESFEIYYNIASAPLWTMPYYIDTAKDLFNDIIGGGIIVFLCQKLYK